MKPVPGGAGAGAGAVFVFCTRTEPRHARETLLSYTRDIFLVLLKIRSQ